MTLREEYLNGIARNDLMAKIFLHQKKHPPHNTRYHIENDDQALHFLNIITHPEWYQVDADKKLSVFISDFPVYPRLCDPPHKLNSICAAPILHGSRPATRGQWEKMCKKRWWEEDERKRGMIPVQIPALEINAMYTCNLQCEYCAHLGRYIKGHVPIESIREWISSWRNRLLPCVVRILGGEPCLHNDLDHVVRAVHEAWPEAQRIIVTNGLIERSDDDFLNAARETSTHILVSVHHDTPEMHKVVDANTGKWQDAGITVSKKLFTTEWRKCYRLHQGKPVPYETDPKTAFDRCCTQRNCITLLDNNLYMCPQAALFQYAYNNKYVGEEWKSAADYRPLPPTCTWRELADFVNCKHEQAICHMCPSHWINATSEEKSNVQGLRRNEYFVTESNNE